MSERRDDTPEPDEPSPAKRDQDERGYYYDDSTGYEVFDPAVDRDDDDDAEERESLEAEGPM